MSDALEAEANGVPWCVYLCGVLVYAGPRTSADELARRVMRRMTARFVEVRRGWPDADGVRMLREVERTVAEERARRSIGEGGKRPA